MFCLSRCDQSEYSVFSLIPTFFIPPRMVVHLPFRPPLPISYWVALLHSAGCGWMFVCWSVSRSVGRWVSQWCSRRQFSYIVPASLTRPPSPQRCSRVCTRQCPSISSSSSSTGKSLLFFLTKFVLNRKPTGFKFSEIWYNLRVAVICIVVCVHFLAVASLFESFVSNLGCRAFLSGSEWNETGDFFRVPTSSKTCYERLSYELVCWFQWLRIENCHNAV